MDAKLSLNFDIQPDLLAVTITENGETLYTGDYSDIANLTLTESKVLSYHIEAKWYEMDGKEGQGSAIYDFDAKVNAPASFYPVSYTHLDVYKRQVFMSVRLFP